MNKRHKGYTLVELIIAVVIAGVIYSVFAQVINSGFDAWFFLKGQRTIMTDVRLVMKRMVRQIRTTAGADNIIAFTATRYHFRNFNNEEIDYQQNGSDLEQNGSVLLSNLDSASGLEFVYLDAAGNVTADKAGIRTIQITLVVKEGRNLVRLRSAAGIRNR